MVTLKADNWIDFTTPTTEKWSIQYKMDKMDDSFV